MTLEAEMQSAGRARRAKPTRTTDGIYNQLDMILATRSAVGAVATTVLRPNRESEYGAFAYPL
jgi:hypothetical protein